MAGKFEVSFQWNRNQLYLTLIGDFDDVAAHELINILENNRKDLAIAFINTHRLEHVCPSGKETFRKDLHGLKDFCYWLVLTAENANQLAPGWIEYFCVSYP